MKPLIEQVYTLLHAHFGPRHWWPAETAFEVVIGAILTQNTAWTNVELAIANLARHAALCPERLAALPQDELEQLLRPAGTFRQKATRLRALVEHLVRHWHGDVAAWCSGPLEATRRRLLEIKGIGPETADSILLYAAHRPSFVVDAYTRRVFSRLGLLTGDESYATIRSLFMQHLPHETTLFNEYHALIVELAKTCCRKRMPLCWHCPLHGLCRYGQRATGDTQA